MSFADSRFSSRVFGLVALATLGYALWRIFQPFLTPILWALLLAFMLHPLNVRLRRRLRDSRGAAAAILTLAVALGLAGPAVILTVSFARQASDLLRRFSAEAGRYRILRPSDVFRLPLAERVMHWIEERVPVTAEQVQRWVVEGVRRLLQTMAQAGGTVFLGALGLFLGLALTLFLLFFFARDGDVTTARLVRILPLEEGLKAHLADRVAKVTRAVVVGTLLTALCQGASVGLAFAIAGIPSPVVFGVVAAAASLLPVGGTALVWGPAAIVLAMQGRWGMAIFVAAWGALVVGAADNLLRPFLVSGRVEISTLPVFFGVLGGLAAFGPIGMFLGPAVIALVLALLRVAQESRKTEDGRRETGGD
jgi:predicted PurR-regulated permease PerM